MSIEVCLTPSLQYVLGDVKSIIVEGETIGECLDNLASIYPRLNTLLFTPQHKLNREFALFVNSESISPDDLEKPVMPGDRLHVVDIIIGG